MKTYTAFEEICILNEEINNFNLDKWYDKYEKYKDLRLDLLVVEIMKCYEEEIIPCKWKIKKIKQHS